MIRTDYVGVHDTGSGVKGIDSWVDTELSNSTRQDSCCVQVSKGGSRSRICQVISRHINGLY